MSTEINKNLELEREVEKEYFKAKENPNKYIVCLLDTDNGKIKDINMPFKDIINAKLIIRSKADTRVYEMEAGKLKVANKICMIVKPFKKIVIAINDNNNDDYFILKSKNTTQENVEASILAMFQTEDATYIFSFDDKSKGICTVSLACGGNEHEVLFHVLNSNLVSYNGGAEHDRT